MMAEKMKRTLAAALAALLCAGNICVPVVAEEGTVVTSQPVVVVIPTSADKVDEGEAKTEPQQSEDISAATDLSITDVFEKNGQQTIVMQVGDASGEASAQASPFQLILTQVVAPEKLGEKVQQPTQTLPWTDTATGLTGSVTVDKSEDTDASGNTVVEESKQASAEGTTDSVNAKVEVSSSSITVTDPNGKLVSQEKTEESSFQVVEDDKAVLDKIVYENGTLTLDKTVESSQTVVTTKTQEGDKIITTTIQTSTEKGSESGLITKEDDASGEQTPVDVTLTPGGGTIVVVVPGSGKEPPVAEKDDRPTDETDKNYDYTDFSPEFVDREVIVQSGELKEDGSKGEVILTPVGPSDKARPGVKKDDEAGDLKYDRVEVDGENIWVPRYERDDSEMPDYLKDLYEYDEESGKWIPRDESGKGSFTEEEAESLKPVEGNIQFVYTQRGEVAVSNIPDIYVYNTSTGKVETWAGIADYMLVDVNGNVVYTYCLDNPTDATQGQSAFELENLDEVTYIQGTEEEQEEAKRHIRAVALNGYWGTDKGMGSVSDIRTDLIEFIESQTDFTLEYDSNKSNKTVSYNFAEDKDTLLAYAKSINAGMALTATQYALWNYGRDSYELRGFSANSKDEEAVMQLLTAYLTSDYLAAKTEKEYGEETPIIDKDNFITDDGLNLTIGDKIADAEVNKDNDNDLYNVDISFTMKVEPSVDGDDLIITLVQIGADGEEQVIRKARIAGSSEEDDPDEFDKIEKNNRTYTFKDVPLAENSKVSFDLKIEGVQNLEYGVYVYKSVHGYDADQTMISVAEGENEVDASVGFDFEFEVEEDDVYEYEHEWSIEVITSSVETETTAPPVVTTAPPVVTTAPPVVTTAPPVVTTPPVTTETTAPPTPETTGPVETTTPPTPETTGPVEETTGPEEETTGPVEETTGPEEETTRPTPETTVPVPETTVPVTTAPETTVPVTTAPETTVPVTTAPETTVPVTTAPAPETISDTTEEIVEIPDEDAPLASPPTGDNSGMMIALSIMSVCALLTLTVFNKKRKA